MTNTWDIPALLAFHRATFGDLRMKADEGDTGEGQGGKGTDGDDAVKTFTQADLDRIVGERLTREKAKFADYDDLKTKAAKADELEAANATESEKAVKAARDEAAAEERKRVAPLLVTAKFEAAAAGRIEDERLAGLLEDLDLGKYLDDKGQVDVEKVRKKVDAWAPAGQTRQQARRLPDLGQGNRSDAGKPSVASVKEDYLENRRKKR